MAYLYTYYCKDNVLVGSTVIKCPIGDGLRTSYIYFHNLRDWEVQDQGLVRFSA
jgi:hypothetical protein